MKIAFFEIEPWEKEVLQRAFPHDTLYFSAEKLTAKNAAKYRDAAIISVFVCSFISDAVLSKMPKLKFIATRSTGFDHIDIKCTQQWSIPTSNVPTYGEETVAEHTFALLLALSRKIVPSVERTRRGNFHLQGLRGFDLKGKTLGVVGTGNIGQHVIRIASGLGMNILAYDLHPDQKLAKLYHFKYASFESVLKNSDIVTLHVPYNKHTHHLLNKENILLMKKGAYLLNTSRGGIIDTDALVTALKTKHLAGAGLDVLEEEEQLREELALLAHQKSNPEQYKVMLENHALLNMPNVLITPHNAFNTQEAMMRVLQTTIDNLKAFKKGRVRNVVK